MLLHIVALLSIQHFNANVYVAYGLGDGIRYGLTYEFTKLIHYSFSLFQHYVSQRLGPSCALITSNLQTSKLLLPSPGQESSPRTAPAGRRIGGLFR